MEGEGKKKQNSCGTARSFVFWEPIVTLKWTLHARDITRKQ